MTLPLFFFLFSFSLRCSMHLSTLLVVEQGSTVLMCSVASSFSPEPVFHKQIILLYHSSQRKQHGNMTITQQSQTVAQSIWDCFCLTFNSYLSSRESEGFSNFLGFVIPLSVIFHLNKNFKIPVYSCCSRFSLAMSKFIWKATEIFIKLMLFGLPGL